MERLQAAIEKARQEQPARSMSAARPAAATDVGARWDALPSVDFRPGLLRRNRIFAFEATPEATAFDVLRTRTLAQMAQNGWRRLAITSPTPGCGKSTVAINLAFALARQAGTRTIQIELDMRRPGQRALLGLPRLATPSNSLPASARLLTGAAGFADVAQRRGAELAMVMNESGIGNASDVLLSGSVETTLDKIEADYQPDLTIFDMPPMLVNDDMIAFSGAVDCVLVVAAAEDTSIKQIDRCERDLARHTNVLGVVLNKSRLHGPDGTYAYDYTY